MDSIRIEFDNSYCYVENNSLDVTKTVDEVCKIEHWYYTRNWHTKRPERKVRDLVFFSSRNGGYVFPRGWFWEVYDKLTEKGYIIRVFDKREPLDLKPIKSKYIDIKYYDYQLQAIEKAIKIRYGVIHHPTGSGKTITMVGLIDYIGTPGFIMVPSRMLLHQTAEVLQKYFPMLEIGLIGDNEFTLGDITIGTSDSLFLKQYQIGAAIDNRFGGKLKFLFTDECLPYHCMVSTEFGSIKIGNLYHALDYKKIRVLSYDPEIKHIYYSNIKRIKKKRKEEIYKIKVAHGVNTSYIRCTGNHKVFANGKMVKAKDLVVGDQLEVLTDE